MIHLNCAYWNKKQQLASSSQHPETNVSHYKNSSILERRKISSAFSRITFTSYLPCGYESAVLVVARPICRSAQKQHRPGSLHSRSVNQPRRTRDISSQFSPAEKSFDSLNGVPCTPERHDHVSRVSFITLPSAHCTERIIFPWKRSEKFLPLQRTSLYLWSLPLWSRKTGSYCGLADDLTDILRRYSSPVVETLMRLLGLEICLFSSFFYFQPPVDLESSMVSVIDLVRIRSMV